MTSPARDPAAVAALTRQASATSHDLRNLITVLAAHGDTLRRNSPLNPEVRASLELIGLAGERLAELASSLQQATEAASCGVSGGDTAADSPWMAPAGSGPDPLPRTSVPSTPRSPGSTPVSPVTILLAEPQQQVRQIVAAPLVGRGHRVLQTTDGPGALALLRRADPAIALAVIDAGLTLPSGRLALDEIVRLPAARAGELALLLMVRGEQPSQVSLASLRCALLSRPFPLIALIDAVATLLARPENALSPQAEAGP